jgi:uncharacterized protein YqgV (UPF0045/DUF77 family)
MGREITAAYDAISNIRSIQSLKVTLTPMSTHMELDNIGDILQLCE